MFAGLGTEESRLNDRYFCHVVGPMLPTRRANFTVLELMLMDGMKHTGGVFISLSEQSPGSATFSWDSEITALHIITGVLHYGNPGAITRLIVTEVEGDYSYEEMENRRELVDMIISDLSKFCPNIEQLTLRDNIGPLGSELLIRMGQVAATAAFHRPLHSAPFLWLRSLSALVLEGIHRQNVMAFRGTVESFLGLALLCINRNGTMLPREYEGGGIILSVVVLNSSLDPAQVVRWRQFVERVEMDTLEGTSPSTTAIM